MRIIAGTYGGRPLKSLSGNNTRPTGDKLKETLFNIIGPYFRGGRVLDLYAGSGALAIEAVSRGIDEAVLVDRSREAVSVIQENVQMTKEGHKFEVIQAPSTVALDRLAGRGDQFKLVFLDPPYDKQTMVDDIKRLTEGDMLDDIAMIVCETGNRVELPETIGELSVWQEKKYGKVKLTIYLKGDIS